MIELNEDITLLLCVGVSAAGWYFYKKWQEKESRKRNEENEKRFRKFVGNKLKEGIRKRLRESETSIWESASDVGDEFPSSPPPVPPPSPLNTKDIKND